MNLNVRYLEEFVTLTEKNNFLEAAECLFISQSCLSKHIKKLETEIGVELFERTTRTVVLTEFGQMLLPYAKKMVSLEYEFEKNVHRKIHQDSGNIVLGSIPSTLNIHRRFFNFTVFLLLVLCFLLLCSFKDCAIQHKRHL